MAYEKSDVFMPSVDGLSSCILTSLLQIQLFLRPIGRKLRDWYPRYWMDSCLWLAVLCGIKRMKHTVWTNLMQ